MSDSAAISTSDASTPMEGFEGPEKVLEVDFAPDLGPARGLRTICKEQWSTILEAARCSILASMSNDYVDSYVLSESSLFVYSHKMILKTCGTTTLLMALDSLLPVTTAIGMKVEWIAYTRKDFQFPQRQQFPHRDPNEESNFLMERFPEGSAYIMGPITGDHWFVFVADYVDRSTDACVDRTLDMMMFGLDESVAKLFVKDKARFPSDSDVTRASGIDTLLPGSMIQEFCFEPCGYSMNGLLYDAYWTIHITPESHCSYASFETNVRMTNYDSLVRAVLAIFRPKRWTMTMFADQAGIALVRPKPYSALIPVTVVESPAKAIMGPCVVTHDTHGNSVVHYPYATNLLEATNANGSTGGSGNGAGAATAAASSESTTTSPVNADVSISPTAASSADAAISDSASTSSAGASVDADTIAVPQTTSPTGDILIPKASTAVYVASEPVVAHPALAAALASSLPVVAEQKSEEEGTPHRVERANSGSPGAGCECANSAAHTCFKPTATSAPVLELPLTSGAAAPASSPDRHHMHIAVNSLGHVVCEPSTPAPTPLAMTTGTPTAASFIKRKPRKAAMSYVISAKCETEFLGGYVSVLANYRLAHTIENTTTKNALAGVPAAASEALSLPRAKYLLEQQAQQVYNRIRGQSL